MRGKDFSPMISILLHKIMDISVIIWTYSYKDLYLIVCSILRIHYLLLMSINTILCNAYSYIRSIEEITHMIFLAKLFWWSFFGFDSDVVDSSWIMIDERVKIYYCSSGGIIIPSKFIIWKRNRMTIYYD